MVHPGRLHVFISSAHIGKCNPTLSGDVQTDVPYYRYILPSDLHVIYDRHNVQPCLTVPCVRRKPPADILQETYQLSHC